MAGQLGELVVSIQADIARFSSDMGRAVKVSQDSANSMAKALGAVHGTINNIGAALGVGLSAASLVALAKHSIEVSDNISKASQKIGVATESLSSLRYAAQLADVDFESLVSGMGKFNRNIVEAAAGSEKQAEAFRALGISQAELRNSSPDELFTKVAEQLSTMEDGAGKTAIAMTLFGKSGANLIPMLNGGAEGLRAAREEAEKLGLVLSTETGKQAEEFNDNLTRMQSAFQGIVNQVMARNLPMMEKLSTSMVTTAKDADAVKEAADTITSGLKLMASAGAIAVGVFKAAGDEVASVAAALTFAAEGEFKKAWEVLGYGGQGIVEDIQTTANKIVAIWDDAAKKIDDKHGDGNGGKSKRKAPMLGVDVEAVKKAAQEMSDIYQLVLQDMAREYQQMSDIYQLELQDQARAAQEASDIYQLIMQDQAKAAQEASDVYQMVLQDQEKAAKLNRDFINEFGTPEEKDFQFTVDRVSKLDESHKAGVLSVQEYHAAVEKEYGDHEKRLTGMQSKTWSSQLGIIGDSLGRMSDIIGQGNKEQFEAAKYMAIAGATINTISAGVAAFAGITEATGGWGIAAAAAEMALVIATGMAQVATIDSMTYQPRAMGGPVQRGSTYLVGERGPELLTMGENGYVTPNNQLGNKGVSVTNVFQVSTGVSDTVRADLARYMPAIEARTVAAVTQAINSGTSLSRAVGRM